MEREIITTHIKYENLELMELSELLYIVNMSINDYYRDNGIANKQVKQYAHTIQSVHEGSIIFNLLIEKIVEFSAEKLTEYIKKRIEIIKNKKSQGKYKKQIFKFENVEKLEIQIENAQNTKIIIIINK